MKNAAVFKACSTHHRAVLTTDYYPYTFSVDHQSCFNLVKNICGAGMLSLPAGVAAFSSHKSAGEGGCILFDCCSAIITFFSVAYSVSLRKTQYSLPWP